VQRAFDNPLGSFVGRFVQDGSSTAAVFNVLEISFRATELAYEPVDLAGGTG